MSLAAADRRVLHEAEALADAVWKTVLGWEPFARDAVGKPLTAAADSAGAHVAAALARAEAGEQLACLYHARGSVFETKYWLNRAVARGLLPDSVLQAYVGQLAELARGLNALAAAARAQRRPAEAGPKAMHEPAGVYQDGDGPPALFSASELAGLSAT